MEDLFKKISQYQLFNFLLSGALFAVLLKETTNINIIYENVIAEFFAFYFIGLIISRIGSLIVEPVFRKFKIIVFAPYEDYVKATKTDSKLDTLSQENNTYRTLIATFLAFAVTYAAAHLATHFMQTHRTLITYVFTLAVIILFSLAYRKQTTYITKRVSQANKK